MFDSIFYFINNAFLREGASNTHAYFVPCDEVNSKCHNSKYSSWFCSQRRLPYLISALRTSMILRCHLWIRKSELLEIKIGTPNRKVLVWGFLSPILDLSTCVVQTILGYQSNQAIMKSEKLRDASKKRLKTSIVLWIFTLGSKSEVRFFLYPSKIRSLFDHPLRLLFISIMVLLMLRVLRWCISPLSFFRCEPFFSSGITASRHFRNPQIKSNASRR